MRAPHDGHTLLGAVNALVSEVPHRIKLEIDMRKALEPVAGPARAGLVLVGNPRVPARNLAELIGHVKANSNRINTAPAAAAACR